LDNFWKIVALFAVRETIAFEQPPPPLKKKSGKGSTLPDFFLRERGGCSQAKKLLPVTATAILEKSGARQNV